MIVGKCYRSNIYLAISEKPRPTTGIRSFDNEILPNDKFILLNFCTESQETKILFKEKIYWFIYNGLTEEVFLEFFQKL